MELLLLSLSLALLLTAITIAFPFLGLKRRSIRLPPGRLGWPILGESLELLTGNPEMFIGDRMRKYSPDHVFKTKILGQNTVVFCGPDANRFLFRNEQTLFKMFHPPSRKKLFCMSQLSSAAESMLLKSLRGFLKPHALVQYLGTMDSTAKQHLQDYCNGKDQVKASHLAKIFTLTLACRFLLGTDDPGRITKLVANLDAVTLGMHCIPLNFPGTIYYRANKAAVAVCEEIQMLIRVKKAAMAREENPQDILSSMMTLIDDPTEQLISEVEVSSMMTGMLVAGYFTVAASITFLMKYMGEQPEIYQKIRSEQLEIAASKKSGELLNWNDIQMMKYSWNVFCEVIRLRPPFQGGLREAAADFTYDGFTIPKGWKIFWTVSTTHKNSEYFPDPEKFDPSRFEKREGVIPFAFVPFGAGPRMCPAKEYVRLVILTFLHNIVKKFRWEPLLPDEKVLGDMIPIPQHGLPLKLEAL